MSFFNAKTRSVHVRACVVCVCIYLRQSGMSGLCFEMQPCVLSEAGDRSAASAQIPTSLPWYALYRNSTRNPMNVSATKVYPYPVIFVSLVRCFTIVGEECTVLHVVGKGLSV